MATAATANGSLGHTHPHLNPPRIRDANTPPPYQEHEEHVGSEVPNGGVKHSSNGGIDMDSMAICASPSATLHHTSRKHKRRKSDEPVESLGGMARRFAVQHQLGLSLNLMLLVGMSYALFPSLRESMSGLLWLSYPTQSLANDSAKQLYSQGPRDLHLVLSFIVFFTAYRAFMLDHVLIPLAAVCGIRKRKGRVRFAEQAHLLVYYYVYWIWGVYLFSRDTPASLPMSGGAEEGKLTFEGLLVSLWTHFPRLAIDAQMKVYYLSQMAFWVQQILVIHLEEKRKDHYQMLTHHFITVALMSTSYGFRQLRVGNAVLVCMDIVDLVFPFAKIMKYIGWQKTCDAAFGVFVFAWLFARHLAYGTICWSIYAHVNDAVMPYGTYSLTQRQTTSDGIVSGVQLSASGGDTWLRDIYQPFVDPEASTVVFNAKIRWAFLGMLGFLQCITLLWFVMIVNVVIRVLKGEGADDTRSDDEGGEDEDETEEDERLDGEKGQESAHGPAQPMKPLREERKFIEVEAGGDELHYSGSGGGGSKRASMNGSVNAPASKRKGFSSGLNLGERKEILNRIGCLSEEQLAREREKMREGSASPRPTSR